MTFQNWKTWSYLGLMGLIRVTSFFGASIRTQLKDRHRSQANGNKIPPVLLIKLLEKVF